MYQAKIPVELIASKLRQLKFLKKRRNVLREEYLKMSYTNSQKILSSPSNPYREFDDMDENDYKEGTSFVERITKFNKNRKPTLWSDFYGLQSSCLLPTDIIYEEATLF